MQDRYDLLASWYVSLTSDLHGDSGHIAACSQSLMRTTH